MSQKNATIPRRHRDASTERGANTSASKQLYRVQFDMTASQLQKVDELLAQFNSVITNKRELFGNALSLLKWAVEERKQGRDIGSQDSQDKQFHRLLLPALDDIEPINKELTNA